MGAVTETFTCASCHGTFPKGWSDEEAAAEAEEFFPGINVTDPEEAGMVCDGCYQHIMSRARAEAPELIGPGWRKGIEVFDMVLPEPYDGPYAAPFRRGGLTSPPETRCYAMASGTMVHVKPGCRCK